MTTRRVTLSLSLSLSLSLARLRPLSSDTLFWPMRLCGTIGDCISFVNAGDMRNLNQRDGATFAVRAYCIWYRS